MKTTVTLALAVLALAPAQAQIFRPEAAGATVLGALAGAIIGHNSGSLNHNAWQGAALGAGTGLILGSIAGDARAWRNTQVPVPAAPRYFVRAAPAGYSYAPSGRPDYSAVGTFLGGIAGAIIGHNSGDLHHNGWRGAALGATAGYVLGRIAEQNARAQEAVALAESQSPAIVAIPPAPAAPQPVTIINNYPARPSPMAAANGLFGR
jgi:uncharacterized membrane protein